MTRKLHHWRLVRICVSTIVFIWITALFLDIHAKWPEVWFQPLRYLQIVPALQLMLATGGLVILAFALILALSLIFGRFYCSFLCPLGALQDFFGLLRRKWGKKKIYHGSKRYPGWRYGFFVLFLLFLFTGTGLGVGLLDPYSHFGRIISQMLIHPWIVLNNSLSGILSQMNIYSLPPLALPPFQLLPFSLALLVFSLLLVLVWKNGRVFCNTVCPVGTGLGFLGRWAPFRIRIHQEKCNACGLCSRVCKAGCLNLITKEVDADRCVVCLNCLTVCNNAGISYGSGPKIPQAKASESRRHFLKILGSGASLPLMAMATDDKTEKRTIAISPPGSFSHKQLQQHCTACQLCITACPSGVLQPALMAYGIEGMMQPMLDPRVAYCNFDCVRCTEVCPTGALQAVTVEEKHRLQLGKAKFLYAYCIVPLENKNCGACSEHCPTKAVNMVPWKGNLYIPEVDETLCVGCGACEHACPTLPLSIFVQGLEIHGLAKIPPSKQEDEEAVQEVMEDFPF